MNSAKRLILIAAVSILSIAMVGLVVGGLEEASAAPTRPATTDVMVTNSSSDPVPVVPQGTTNVSGSVQVGNTATSPVPVAQQGTVNVLGKVGISSDANIVKLDPSSTVKLDTSAMNVSGTVGISSTANTVKLDSNTVKLDPAGNTVKLDTSGMTVSGTVGITPDANTVKLDAAANTVGLSGSANTVKIDPGNNTVKVDATSSIPLSGTVGLSSDANTVKFDQTPNTTNNLVKIDDAYQNSHPVKVWGWTGLDPTANNKVQAANPIDPETKQAVPLLVQVVGGGAGGSAQQPVQFTHEFSGGNTVDAYTVPAGQRLKIEQVSVWANTSTLWPQFALKTTVGGVTAAHWLPRLEAEYVQQEGVNNQIFSAEAFRVNAQVAIYADEGTVVQSVGQGSGTFKTTYSGYLTAK